MTAEVKRAALEQMVGYSLTRGRVDNARAVLLLKIDPSMLPFVLERRRRWLDWLTLTQRKWQTDTRRPAKARHHDSIALRNKYVQCGNEQEHYAP